MRDLCDLGASIVDHRAQQAWFVPARFRGTGPTAAPKFPNRGTALLMSIANVTRT